MAELTFIRLLIGPTGRLRGHQINPNALMESGIGSFCPKPLKPLCQDERLVPLRCQYAAESDSYRPPYLHVSLLVLRRRKSQ